MPRDLNALNAALPGIAFVARKDGDEIRRMDAPEVPPEEEENQWVDPVTLPEWDQAAYDAAIQKGKEQEVHPPLTSRQFKWMLAYYDLESIWAGVKSDNKPTDAGGGNRRLYANLAANENSDTYYLDNTLFFLGQIRNQPKIAASGVDLSDDAIRYYWRHAAAQTFESMVDVVPHPDNNAV